MPKLWLVPVAIIVAMHLILLYIAMNTLNSETTTHQQSVLMQKQIFTLQKQVAIVQQQIANSHYNNAPLNKQTQIPIDSTVVTGKLMSFLNKRADETYAEKKPKVKHVGENWNARRIFIDVGAMAGDTLDVLRRFRSNPETYICYAWEPNPENLEKLRSWIQKHSHMNVKVIKKAAWIKNGQLRFNNEQDNDGKIVSQGGYVVRSGDISQWMLNNFNKNDFVFLKMDIEAAEFQVLPAILKSGAMDLVDELQLEWHDWGDFTSNEHTQQRKKLEKQIADNGLIFQYATFDVDTYFGTDWNKVRKFRQPEEYPHPWVDMHYFRNNADSPWKL